MGEVYRSESRRILATLIRLLGDFELPEEAMHDTFAEALAQWPRDGIPTHPRACLRPGRLLNPFFTVASIPALIG